jgi:site-specific DNA recombinase
VPAAEIENAVIDQLRGLLRAPEIVVRTWRAARQSIEKISEAEVREALERLDPLWDELFPAEQARIVQLLVERVEVHRDRLDVRLRTAGLTKLAGELRSPADSDPTRRAA